MSQAEVSSEVAPSNESQISAGMIPESELEPVPLERQEPTQTQPSNEKLSEVFGTCANMCNCILGAGIIGIPSSIQYAGFVVGVVMFVLVCVLMDKTLRMIVELASFHPKTQKLGIRYYEDLARVPFGKLGSSLVLISMGILAYGKLIADLLIIKQTVPQVLGFIHHPGREAFWRSEVTMVVASLVIIVPLIMMRDLASLEKYSLLSVTADVVLVIFVAISAPIKSTLHDAGGFGEVLKKNWGNSGIFVALGVVSTSMACNHSVFIIANSLRNKTSKRWSQVTFRSISVSGTLTLIMGIVGYLGFLATTKSNVLDNFDSSSVMANVGRALLAVTMFLTYPTDCLVVRHVLVVLLLKRGRAGAGDTSSIEGSKILGFFNRRHQVTLAIYICTLAPALAVDDLGPVLSLTGAIGASFLAFIATGALYLGINGDEFLDYCNDLLDKPKVNRSYNVEVTADGNNGVQTELTNSQTAEVEQPTQPTQNEPEKFQMYAFVKKILRATLTGWKPWWWYLFGFPVWTYIASKGAIGTRKYAREFAGVDGNVIIANADEDHFPIGPRVFDYYVSMFLIVFGVIAMVLGVICNFVSVG